MADLAAKARELLAEGKVEESLAASRQAWPVAKKAEDKNLQAEVLVAMVAGLSAKGSVKEAFRAASSSLALVKASGDKSLIAEMLNLSAKLSLKATSSEEDLAEAVANAEEASKMYKALSDGEGEAKALITLGMAYNKTSKYNQAITTAEAALALWRPLEQAAGSVAALEVIIEASEAKGNPKASMKAFEDEFALMKKAGFSTKNMAMMLEKMVVLAASQGFLVEAVTYYDELIADLDSMGDKMGEAVKTLQCAEMLFGMKQNRDAVRYGKKAQALFAALHDEESEEKAKKLSSAACVLLGQQSEAPYRSEGLMALKDFAKGVDLRDLEKVKSAEEVLNKTSSVITEAEINLALENIFEKDPSALKFVEELGWDVDSFKSAQHVYSWAHKTFYMGMILGGMNFGPQFRGVYPNRVGTRATPGGPKSAIIAQCYDTEKWQHELHYRHCLIDSPIQSSSMGHFPPHTPP